MGGRDRGFSLVELLIVVAVIALLAAMVLPGLSRAREYAYFTSCKNSLRQSGIAFLLYAGNNRGRMPEARVLCGGGFNDVMRVARMGHDVAELWPFRLWCGGEAYPGWRLSGTQSFLYKVYGEAPDDDAPWGGGVNSDYKFVSTGELPGKYAPIELLWDPITMVRDWGPWGRTSPKTWDAWSAESGLSGEIELHSGNRMFRDLLARHNYGVFGYAFFLGSVGCPRYREDRYLLHRLGEGDRKSSNCEFPVRLRAKSSPLTTGANPSCWVGACLTPITTVHGMERNFRSHFGLRQTIPDGFRFNVVHLDGHVDDSLWKEPWVSTAWDRSDPKYDNRPYGWAYKGVPSDTNGLNDDPEWQGAFDANM